MGNIYPTAKYKVLTYNKIDSIEHQDLNAELVSCLHRYIDFGHSNFRWANINDSCSIKEKWFKKITYNLSNSKFNTYRILNSSHQRFTKTIRHAELFVMSGGGYFNEGWPTKVFSQLKELEIAQSLGIETLILGPTIGKLTQRQKEMTKRVFNKSKFVAVRDDSSQNTLSEIGVESTIIPDIAMAKWITEHPTHKDKINKVGVIYTSGVSMASFLLS